MHLCEIISIEGTSESPKHVLIATHIQIRKLQQGEAYAVCLVECDYFADLNVSGYENMLRGIRSSLYRYDFTEVHLLSH